MTSTTSTTDLSHPRSTVLGFPRIGVDRALKRALESHWRGELSGQDLLDETVRLRGDTWQRLADSGMDEIPVNDFSLYDHVLDAAVMVGAVPERHREAGDGLATYFAMARGNDQVAPLEMTKWFDTNYHYLVPEIGPETGFAADASKPLGELTEALARGLDARPVLVGPVTFLLLSKPAPGAPEDFSPLDRLDDLLVVYRDILEQLAEAGAAWVQLDEPSLVQDQPAEVLAAVARAYAFLGSATARPKIVVASYFDRLGEALPVLREAPVEGLAMDLTGPARQNLADLLALGGLPGKRLYAGVVDGHNVWVNDLRDSFTMLDELLGCAEQLVVSTSCSLLHVPLDLQVERRIDPVVRDWLAFAAQKVTEVGVLARGLSRGTPAVHGELEANAARLTDRRESRITRNPAVRERVSACRAEDEHRSQPYAERAELQQARLRLPTLPTTTIGSFPQTAALRKARADLAAKRIEPGDYRTRIAEEIAATVTLQESIGLDVLVHGEPERNDMVQYFAEQLVGYVVSDQGWVQSYGSRCVRPPILVGDVSRPEPMTVGWTTYAQSLTQRPVKGMLTGPVTMLAWSFVRDDQPAASTAVQVALALRDEVTDLEAAGIAVVQVDEPALRETLPLRRADRAAYEAWATRAFRLTTSGVRDDTQVHTHMCYAEFGDVLDAITALDADVISFEAARSGMVIARELAEAGYPAAAGPGVYDIHSPRVPTDTEMARLLHAALVHLSAGRVWVNPDCGLKTRTNDEVETALRGLVAAARTVREHPGGLGSLV